VVTGWWIAEGSEQRGRQGHDMHAAVQRCGQKKRQSVNNRREWKAPPRARMADLSSSSSQTATRPTSASLPPLLLPPPLVIAAFGASVRTRSWSRRVAARPAWRGIGREGLSSAALPSVECGERGDVVTRRALSGAGRLRLAGGTCIRKA